MKEQRVVCAAMINTKGQIICSPRHWDKIARAAVKNVSNPEDWETDIEQGFVDQFGQFLTREEALKIAQRNKQIAGRCGGDDIRLYSENLY